MRRLMMRRAPDGRGQTGDDARRRRLRLPTSGAALAVSIVALVVAMAGSAYAGSTLANGSVGTKQLQKGAVTTNKWRRRRSRTARSPRAQSAPASSRPA